jgi:hypothetical protein
MAVALILSVVYGPQFAPFPFDGNNEFENN